MIVSVSSHITVNLHNENVPLKTPTSHDRQETHPCSLTDIKDRGDDTPLPPSPKPVQGVAFSGFGWSFPLVLQRPSFRQEQPHGFAEKHGPGGDMYSTLLAAVYSFRQLEPSLKKHGPLLCAGSCS